MREKLISFYLKEKLHHNPSIDFLFDTVVIHAKVAAEILSAPITVRKNNLWQGSRMHGIRFQARLLLHCRGREAKLFFLSRMITVFK
jgi:hypothetical protein